MGFVVDYHQQPITLSVGFGVHWLIGSIYYVSTYITFPTSSFYQGSHSGAAALICQFGDVALSRRIRRLAALLTVGDAHCTITSDGVVEK